MFCAGYFMQSQSHLTWHSLTASRPLFFPLLHYPVLPGSRSRRAGCNEARGCFWTRLSCIRWAPHAARPLLQREHLSAQPLQTPEQRLTGCSLACTCLSARVGLPMLSRSREKHFLAFLSFAFPLPVKHL